jgi:hypothetical protein
MTTPHERYRAVMQTEQFLLATRFREDVPEDVREECQRLLRHFPSKYDFQMIEDTYAFDADPLYPCPFSTKDSI